MQQSVMQQGNGQDPIFLEVRDLLLRFRKTDVPITEQTEIAKDLNLDSLAVMDLMMELEDNFDVSIPLNLIPEITNVGQLASAIREVKGA